MQFSCTSFRDRSVKFHKLALALVLLTVPCFAQSALDVPKTHAQKSGNLVELLRFVSQEYRVPILGELVYPVPTLSIAEGDATARNVLRELTKVAPEYEFQVANDCVVHFYRKGIVETKGNLLNVRLESFALPRNMSEFKLYFPAKLGAALKGIQGGGIVTSGFRNVEMEKETLPQIVLKNATGREVLVRAAEATRGFYSILVFPSLTTDTGAPQDYTFQHWFWGSVYANEDGPIYIQTPPK